MNKFNSAAFVFIAVCAFSVPAFAAEQMKEGMMMMVHPDGKTHMMEMSDMKMSEMMMKDGKMMSSPMMMMMKDGKMYMMEDKKMKSGKMMSDTMMKK